MRLNVKPTFTETTHEGAPAKPMTPMQALRRSVMSCLLWEREFYEDGEEIAARIVRLAGQVPVTDLAALAVEVRQAGNLRHVPLLLLSVLAERGSGSPLVGETIFRTIQRADEMAELLAVHAARNKVAPSALKRTVSKQMKVGLASALHRFDEYQLAKYDRAGAVRLRDVIRLAHPKPENAEQAALWKRAMAGELVTPDTWEVALSGGADKCEAFTRLLTERKLGYLALLRNLRNMAEAGVDPGLMREAIVARRGGAERVLPFRYIAAARACPQMEPALDQALSEAILSMPVLSGKTIVLVDVSPSMDDKLSSRSDMTRMDAAAALASVIHGDLRVFSFSARGLVRDGWNYRHDGRTPVLVEVPPRRGMAGVDAILKSQERNGTLLGRAVAESNAIPHDRLIVVSDEESADPVPQPVAARAYMINVASAKNGVGYGRWTHIDGFSEGVLRWIHEFERPLD